MDIQVVFSPLPSMDDVYCSILIHNPLDSLVLFPEFQKWHRCVSGIVVIVQRDLGLQKLCKTLLVPALLQSNEEQIRIYFPRDFLFT